jgi:hypothetical protein
VFIDLYDKVRDLRVMYTEHEHSVPHEYADSDPAADRTANLMLVWLRNCDALT